MRLRNSIYKLLNLFSPISSGVYKNRLRVLAYHDISDPITFENQILWLKLNFNLIDITTLKDHLFDSKPLPSKALLITMDDGDISVYTKGLAVLKKHKIFSCLFIITDLIDSNKDFWWDTIIKNERENGLSEQEIKKVLNQNKLISNSQRVQNLLDYNPTYKEQLTIEQLHELEDNGVYIGNHSHTHPMFNQLNNGELKHEMDEAYRFFKKYEIGDYSTFAYPNGNFNQLAENQLIGNHVKLAFLFDHNINAKKINPLRISRITVNSDTPLAEFKTKVSGLHPKFFSLKNRFF